MRAVSIDASSGFKEEEVSEIRAELLITQYTRKGGGIIIFNDNGEVYRKYICDSRSGCPCKGKNTKDLAKFAMFENMILDID